MSFPNVVIGVQCRLSSTRLPCKALLELADTTILGMCIERAKDSTYPVFILTSEQEEDDLIASSALRYGADGVIRGSLDHVLSRYVNLAEQSSCDYIVRVTADNPLTEFGFVSPLVDHALEHDLPYVWVEPSLCPEGTNIEVFSKEILFKSAISDFSSFNREHVTPYMRSNISSDHCLRRTASIYFPYACDDLSFTVDTSSDYVSLARLINHVVYNRGISWRSPEFVQVCAELASKEPFTYASGRNHALP